MLDIAFGLGLRIVKFLGHYSRFKSLHLSNYHYGSEVAKFLFLQGMKHVDHVLKFIRCQKLSLISNYC